MNLTTKQFMRAVTSSVSLFALVFLATSCGSNVINPTSYAPPQTANSSPSVTEVSPSYVIAGNQQTILNITGSGFEKYTSVSLSGISLTPQYISSQALSVTLTPSDISTPGNYTLVVSNPAPGGGTSSSTFRVWQTVSDATTALSVSMPDFDASVTLMVQSNQNGGLNVIPNIQKSGSSVSATGFLLEVFPNPTSLGLLQWFESNIDVNNTLISSGAYNESVFPDGRSVLVSGTGSTQDYFSSGGDHELYYAYTVTATGQVVAITRAWEPDLYDQGYLDPSESLNSIEIGVLSSVHF